MPTRLSHFARWLTRLARSSEAVFILIAIAIGAAAGLLTILIGAVARTLQHHLFHLAPQTRLSELTSIHGPILLVLPLGGAALSLFTYLARTSRRPMVDAVEANALHGGRMSMRDSLVVSGQTVMSNGFGASVGLEAAYAQLGGAAASVAARVLNLRRGDRARAGRGGRRAPRSPPRSARRWPAPSTRSRSSSAPIPPSAIAPVAAASLAAALVAQLLGRAALCHRRPRAAAGSRRIISCSMRCSAGSARCSGSR